MLEVVLDDGRNDIVHAAITPSAEEDGEDAVKYHRETFESETALLVWLKTYTEIPVPEVRHVVRRSDDEPYAFAVLEKLPGEPIGIFGSLNVSAQVRTES